MVYFDTFVLFNKLRFLTDLIKRNALRVDKIQTLLIDKADGILNKGFQKQLYNIYGYLSPTTQVLLHLNTFEKICHKYLDNF